MRFKARKVTRANGEVDFKFHLSLSGEEANMVPRIADWDATTMDFHRQQGDDEQRADWVLMQARLVAYWSGMLKTMSREQIIRSIQQKSVPKPVKKRRRK